jgi:molybdopterin-containing oxidoreductase family membrane subunit
VTASAFVLAGMWLERFLIIVPSLSHKYAPYAWGHYRPRTPEILLTIATFGAMALLYVVFAKVVPIISVWELKVGAQPEHAMTTDEAEEAQGLWRTEP